MIFTIAPSTVITAPALIAIIASAWIAISTDLMVIFAGSILMLLAPTFYTSKFGDPLFWPVATAVLVVYLIGQVIIKKITTILY